MAGGGHWDHCQPACPQDQPARSNSSQTSQELSVETDGDSLCFTQVGLEGRCRLVASCIGATTRDLETNSCELSDGSQGTCCVPISVENIINIIDTPHQTIALPGTLDPGQVNDIFIRSSLGQPEDEDRVRFASEEPAEDVEVDTNFVDDPTPANLHLRSDLPSHSTLYRHIVISPSYLISDLWPCSDSTVPGRTS